MNVGDVHWVDFPPRGGHAQAGRRPAIVAQDESATTRLPTI
jgi:mRNA-degrading endonuclease toxin of MazEF toxin-antitoxin module